MAYLQMIREYVPTTEEQAEQKRMILWYIARNQEDVLTRQNPAAHLTSSAMILNPGRDKALMVYHNIYRNWSWTGGHCDGDPDLPKVALREAQEETGIGELTFWRKEPVSLDVIPVMAHYKKGRYVCAHLHLSVAFGLIADDTLPLRIKPDENSDVAWVPLEELWERTRAEPGMQKVYRGILDRMLKE
jgi:8-oxo-dGTP pyrophosphatase MutT (NUDIX family)